MRPESVDPCNPSPCGSNAVCKRRGDVVSCQCIPDYHGDPYDECRPECVINADCPSSKQCRDSHCVDPCPGVCGTNAYCQVPNHLPICACSQGYTGDPFTACKRPSLTRKTMSKTIKRYLLHEFPSSFFVQCENF